MFQVNDNFKQAYTALQHVLEARLVKFGLTRSQTEILMRIGMANGIEHRALLEQLQVTSPTLTSVLNDLEARKLIQRDVSQTDARVRLLYLTDAGREIATQVQREATLVLDRIFSDFSEGELSLFAGLLQRVIDKSSELLK